MTDFPERSHEIVEVDPKHTGTHQRPIRADHENNVNLNQGRTAALITNGRRRDRRDNALRVTFHPEGSNHLLDPPAVIFEFVGNTPTATVTIESLLFALKCLIDSGGGDRWPS